MGDGAAAGTTSSGVLVPSAAWVADSGVEEGAEVDVGADVVNTTVLVGGVVPRSTENPQLRELIVKVKIRMNNIHLRFIVIHPPDAPLFGFE